MKFLLSIIGVFLLSFTILPPAFACACGEPMAAMPPFLVATGGSSPTVEEIRQRWLMRVRRGYEPVPVSEPRSIRYSPRMDEPPSYGEVPPPSAILEEEWPGWIDEPWWLVR